MNILKFKPIYIERVWGGSSLKTYFNRILPKNKIIGESWDISDRTEATSIIDGGKFDSMSLRQVIEADSAYIMGDNWDKYAEFPVLIKWLDCTAKLSIQVHPDKETAKILKSKSKTECWYIYKASKGSNIIAGFKEKTTKQDFINSINNGTTQDLVQPLDVNNGDSFFVPTGRIHCIGAGNLILEIQENSDTTYRVYDWDRTDLNGKKRHLHIEESLACINFNDVRPQKLTTNGESAQICNCPEFNIRTLKLKTGERLTFNKNEQVRILSVVEGFIESICGGTLSSSESAIMPYAQAQIFIAKQDTLILITENFNK